METNWQLDGYLWEKLHGGGGMQILQEMLPVSMKRMELEKSSCPWGQESGAGLGMDVVLHPSVPSACSNIHRGSCHQPPASATARARKQRNGKNQPTTLPQLSKGAPGKSLGAKQSRPHPAGDNGDKAAGQREPVSPRWVCASPCPARRAPVMLCTHKGHLRDTEWLPPPQPKSTDHHRGTTQLCQHQNRHQTHQHSPVPTAVVSCLARHYPDNKDDG